MLSFRSIALRRLEQKPDAAFGFVDPDLDEARRSDVAMLLTHIVRGSQRSEKRLVVLAQVGDHVECRYILGIIVHDALQPPDLADRSDRQTANLAHALRNDIGHREDLVSLL